MFENYSKCRIWIFHQFLSYKKLTCLVTLLDPFLSTQNVNIASDIARFARNVEWDFFCNFQTSCHLYELQTDFKIFSGEKGIEFDQLDRPSSAATSSSATLPSRPSTAQSSRDASNTPRDMQKGPPAPSQPVGQHNSSSSANANEESSENNKNPYALEGHSPAVDTKLEDVVDELPEHVLSRSGTPSQWAFDDKDASLKTGPPRPTSASLCSPPVPRKVPISVDHHLRK